MTNYFLVSRDSSMTPYGREFMFKGIAGLDPRSLKDNLVFIDGYRYNVISVETYAVNDPTGRNFGLIVDKV